MDIQHTTQEKYTLAVLPTPQIMVKFRDLLKRKAGTAAVASLTNLNIDGLFPVSDVLCCDVLCQVVCFSCGLPMSTVQVTAGERDG